MTSKLLIDEYPLIVLPKLAAAIGLNEAIVLQQIHYWVETFKKTRDDHHDQAGHWWVWNTSTEWQENFPFWSERTIWRVLESLRKQFTPSGTDRRVKRGTLVITGNYNRKGYDKTLWYRIDYAELDRIEKAYCQVVKMALTKCQDGIDKVSTPIPETSSETSSDIKNHAPSGAVSPEQEQQADIESFHNGDVPEIKPREPPRPVAIDVIDHIVQQSRRLFGEIDWLLPGTPCGDHDYLAPYQTFCDVLARDPSTIGAHKTLKWLNQFAKMAIVSPGDNGSDAIVIPPAVMAQAIKSIRDDWSFKNKKWRTPYSSGFAELVELTASQIECGALESEAPSASKSLSEAGYDAEAVQAWAKIQQ